MSQAPASRRSTGATTPSRSRSSPSPREAAGPATGADRDGLSDPGGGSGSNGAGGPDDGETVCGLDGEGGGDAAEPSPSEEEVLLAIA